MRPMFILIPLAALLLTACGTTEERTVVVQPAPGTTVVVPPSGDAHVVSPD
jgi:ABC-type Fe3+-hydroxamate transport system substrate-binding protein